MFKGRVEKVSHEGGLLVSYTGACPALGSVMIDSGETYIGKVDGVIGNLDNSLVHIAHLDRKANPQQMVGLEIKMKCVFISKFDSWKPIEISNNNISPRREIICYKKK